MKFILLVFLLCVKGVHSSAPAKPEVTSFLANSMPSRLDASEGDTVTFVCDAQGQPRPSVTVRAQRSNTSVALQTTVIDDTNVTGRGDLKMSCNSTDTYFCIPRSEVSIGRTRNVSVFVACQPELNSSNPDKLEFSTSEKKVFQLKFAINSYPPPNDYTLFKENITDETRGRKKRSVTQTEVPKDGYQTVYIPGQPPQGTVILQMFGLSEENSGNYALKIDNGVGNSLVVSFSVTVKKVEDDDDGLGVEAWVGIVTGIIGAIGVIVPAIYCIVQKMRTRKQ